MSELLHSAEFWVFLSFVIFVIVMIKPAKRLLTAALDERIARIREEVEEAQRLRKEAQAALASYQRRQREAHQEAENIVAHAREEAERMAARAMAELDETINRREQQAAAKIAQAEAAAVDEIRERAVDLAIAAAGKLLAEKMSGKPGDDTLSAAIKDIPNKLH